MLRLRQQHPTHRNIVSPRLAVSSLPSHHSHISITSRNASQSPSPQVPLSVSLRSLSLSGCPPMATTRQTSRVPLQRPQQHADGPYHHHDPHHIHFSAFSSSASSSASSSSSSYNDNNNNNSMAIDIQADTPVKPRAKRTTKAKAKTKAKGDDITTEPQQTDNGESETLTQSSDASEQATAETTTPIADKTTKKPRAPSKRKAKKNVVDNDETIQSTTEASTTSSSQEEQEQEKEQSPSPPTSGAKAAASIKKTTRSRKKKDASDELITASNSDDASTDPTPDSVNPPKPPKVTAHTKEPDQPPAPSTDSSSAPQSPSNTTVSTPSDASNTITADKPTVLPAKAVSSARRSTRIGRKQTPDEASQANESPSLAQSIGTHDNTREATQTPATTSDTPFEKPTKTKTTTKKTATKVATSFTDTTDTDASDGSATAVPSDVEVKEKTTDEFIEKLVEQANKEYIKTIAPPDTVIVQDEESALRVLEILNRPDVRNRYHACDTETMGIDPKVQSPVGNGTVICLSIYVGPDVDFGGGSRIWVDNFGKSEGVMNYFKKYLEDETIKKVWHNYSFDRHVIYNHGIDVKGFGGDTMHMARLWNSGRTGEGGNYSLESLSKDLVTEIPHKESMNKRFSYHRPLKSGELAKVATVPGTLELQLSPEYRTEWIDYSVRDAQATWYLRKRLEEELKQWPWTSGYTMFDFYNRYWLHFGEMLTDMERVGIYVLRKDYLPKARAQAEKDKKVCEEKFLEWAIKQRDECRYMNPSSEQQKQQLLFGPLDEKDVHKSGLDPVREFETENTFNYVEPGKTIPKRKFKFGIRGLGMPVIARTPKGKPQVNIEVIKALAGNPFANPPKYGQAFDFFGKGEKGKEACESLYQLVKLAGIDITISTFIDPLTELPDEKDRVHCSLNLNTETGRLSARKPNLQNQPALDKDIYKIRAAFAAEPGNSLVVADYGQLELRVLAHIAKCKSMIDAFKLGGDFHSRTAMGMYPHVAEAVSKGDVLLEWDFSQGVNPKPLLKEKFSNERKKAKILNFSIAYGKTVRGLASDWGVSLEEAKQTVDAWYSDRPEVLEWQKKTIAEARKTGVTRTIMGRYRPVHGINDPSGRVRGHAERMSINTPIQGGAADIVMAGMLKLHSDQELRDLGWKVLLQIHDELIVEGPEEHEKRALEIVTHCMSHPFKNDLLVDLVVDANIAKTWYEGK